MKISPVLRLCAFAAPLILSETSHPVFATNASELIAQADAAYAKREDVPQAKIAMVTYEQIAVMSSTRAVEAYWKASRSAWWLGENASERSEALDDFQSAMNLAQKAIDLNRDSVEAHFWLGATAGCYGKAKGILKSLALVKPIRHEMAEVIRLNDRFMNGAAYRVLGVVDYKVPALMGGNKTRAKGELDKAFAMGPSDPFVQYDYVDFYKTTGDLARSNAAFNALRTLQVPSELEPDRKMLERKAEQILSR
jgi:tetratricopeptide (TPR) repeat protein